MKRVASIVVALRLTGRVCLCLGLLISVPSWSQMDNSPSRQPVPAMVGTDNNATPADNGSSGTNDSGSDRMLTPPPVSGQSYPTALASEGRSNYLRGGLSFTAAYTDNAIGSVNGTPVSDVSYSVAPFVSIDETTSRTHLQLTYAPGFTFYQRLSDRNEADQNASINFSLRLSPHVTLNAQDGFQKSSNVFNQPDLASAGAVSGGAQGPNFSIIAPVADRLSNSGTVGLTYQFARNASIGGSGTFSNLHYPDPAQVPGLYDSGTQGGSAFYSLRISRVHYIGASYQYQRLVSYPTEGQSETQTHTVFFFYTVYPSPRFSLSFFGGPQHSDTIQPPQPPLLLQIPAVRAWTPTAGTSLSWQGRLTSFSLSYSHAISGGGGLIGAVKMDNASATIRQQITKTLSGSVAGAYVQNDVLGQSVAGMNGHSISGTASLGQMIGEHVNLQLGYSRVRQVYSGVEVLALTPNTNREYISVSYQFSRPLGR